MEQLKENIINHLIKKGNYDETVDNFVIDMLIENVQFAEIAKEDIINRGLVIDIINGNGIISPKMNPSFGIYRMCVSNIHQAASKLGISRNERIKLKLLEQKVDEFENDFN